MNKTTLLIIALAAHVSLLEAAPKSLKALQQKQKAAAQALAQNKRRPYGTKAVPYHTKETRKNITYQQHYTLIGTKKTLNWASLTAGIQPTSEKPSGIIVLYKPNEKAQYTALYHGVTASVWAERLYKEILASWKSNESINYEPLTPQERNYLIQQESNHA